MNTEPTQPELWQIYSDPLKREVALCPAKLRIFSLSNIGILSLPIGDPGPDPRETCIAAITQCKATASHYIGAPGNDLAEENGVLARAEAIRLARAIEVLVHCLDSGIHALRWPS